MATETGTVEIPTETTEEASADTQDAVTERLEGLFSDEQPEAPQKSEEQEQPASEEQPTQETESTSETEPEAPAAAESPDDDPDDGLPPDVQLRVNKRIGKEVAKRKEFEERLEALEGEKVKLEAKVKELTDAPKEPDTADTAADPLLSVPEIAALHKQEQEAENAFRQASELIRTVRKDPDAVIARLKEITKRDFADADEARDWLEGVKENAMLKMGQASNKREAASQRHIQKLEKEHAQNYEKAVKALPALTDKTSKEFKVAQELTQRFKGLLNPVQVPDGPMILAYLTAGKVALEAKAAAPAATKAAPPKLPSTGKTGSGTTRTAVARPPVNALKQKAFETGTDEDIEAALGAIL